VINKTAVASKTDRRMPHIWIRIGDDVRRLRVEAGVSLRELADATGIDASYLARIERYRARPSLPTLTSISVALGADLSLRFYAGKGPRIHDRFQAPMIDTLLRSLAPCWMPRLEVVVPPPTRGVVDVVLTDRQRPMLVIGEAQSEFRRIEQQLRWTAEKAAAFETSDRERRSVSRLLIVRSTESTRAISRQFAATLSTAYPARSTDVFDALTRGSPWPDNGMVWMRVENGSATLLEHPPRGVRVGR
jgi:transcriptional regulator with XRE-family HTH domain